MALLLMGFGEAVVVLCRRYLVANRWIEVGANTGSEKFRLRYGGWSARLGQSELAGGVSTNGPVRKCSWAAAADLAWGWGNLNNKQWD
jgi:hypothetical protein